MTTAVIMSVAARIFVWLLSMDVVIVLVTMMTRTAMRTVGLYNEVRSSVTNNVRILGSRTTIGWPRWHGRMLLVL